MGLVLFSSLKQRSSSFFSFILPDHFLCFFVLTHSFLAFFTLFIHLCSLLIAFLACLSQFYLFPFLSLIQLLIFIVSLNIAVHPFKDYSFIIVIAFDCTKQIHPRQVQMICFWTVLIMDSKFTKCAQGERWHWNQVLL